MGVGLRPGAKATDKPPYPIANAPVPEAYPVCRWNHILNFGPYPSKVKHNDQFLTRIFIWNNQN